MMTKRFSMMLCVGALAGVAVCAGCSGPSEAEKANAKRWENFQKQDVKDQAVGMSAFEKRQAQLAEKKQKEAAKAAGKPNGGTADPSKAGTPTK